METPPKKKTMFNYFTKLPSKASTDEENPRKVAPVFNKQHVEQFLARQDHFDQELLATEDNSKNYMKCLKSGEHVPFRLKKPCKGSLRARLIQFHEDVRPPYFGTWQKKSSMVTGRRPHRQDNEIFDYDIDSEAEWDIGGPGESLKGDDSEDEEELDDYEIDMKTFVPHGYVSDDEIADEVSDSEDKEQADNRNKNCDVENDSNSDVKIISEIKVNPQQVDQQQAQKHTPKMDLKPITPKMEMKPITLGLNFEENPSVSETKLQFLRAFEGVSCK